MFKIDKNARHTVAALLSVIMWAFGNLAGPGMVYCVTGPDHAAIEPIHWGLHMPSLSMGGDEPAVGSNSFRSVDRDFEPCTDMPIFGFASRQVNPEHAQFMKLSAWSLQAASHPSLLLGITGHPARDSLPSIAISHYSHLRTTVWLI